MSVRKKERGKGSFMRMCSGCNRRKHKDEMIRIVAPKNDKPFIDISGKSEDRGVYVCNDIKCIQRLNKSRRLSKLLKVEIPNEIYDELEKLIIIEENK